jgi:hypothetical protein
MLTADQLDVLPKNILDLYYKYEESIINDIARRISKMSFDSAAWQVQRLNESALLYEEILVRLSELTGKSEVELKRIFDGAGVKAMRFDDSIYKKAGLEPLPLNMSPAMVNVLSVGLQKTMGTMRNLTQSTAITAQQSFFDAADLAYTQVSTGAMSYTQAVSEAVLYVADNGIKVINYASGRQDQLDVAIRRSVLTGVNQTVGELQLQRAEELGQDLVETSAHAGARPSHALWQGKIFSRSGKSKKYPPFVESTGYGTITGLLGINCRHSFFPFFEGLSQNAYDEATREELANKKVTYQGNEISQYDASQIQRGIERQIRFWKRRESALDAAGQIYSPEAVKAINKVDIYQKQMRAFIKETKLDRQRIREQI